MMIRRERKYRWLLLGLAMSSILACQSAPKSKDEVVVLTNSEDPTVRCIGLQRDPAGGLIERCNLETWADVPGLLVQTKKLAVTIGDDKTRIIPCGPNTTWIGIISGIIVKCRKNNKVRFYWKRVEEVQTGSQIYIFEGGGAGVPAIVYNGIKTKKYLISGLPGRPSSFLPTNSKKNPDASNADMLIEDVLEEESE